MAWDWRATFNLREVRSEVILGALIFLAVSTLSFLIALIVVATNKTTNVQNDASNKIINDASNKIQNDTSNKIKNDTSNEICSNKNCVLAAAKILQNLDGSADPCKNFYQFACGGAKQLGFKDKDMQAEMRHILESENNTFNLVNITVAKYAYEECLNMPKVENMEKKIKDFVKSKGYNNDENRQSGEFNWTASVYKLREIGYTEVYPLKVSVAAYPNTTNKMIIKVGKFILLGHELLGSETKSATSDEDDQSNNPNDDKCTVFDQEYGKLWNEDEDLEIMKTKKFFDYYEEKFAMEEYVTKMLPSDFDISSIEYIMVDNNFVPKFIDLMSRSTKECHEDWLQHLIQKETSRYFPNKKTTCTDIISRSDWQFTVAYFKQYLKEIQGYILKMIDNIRQSFKNEINESKWMDNASKRVTIEKLENIKKYVGFPDNFINMAMHRNLTVEDLEGKKFLETMFEISKKQMDNEFFYMNYDESLSQWNILYYPTVINALYNFKKNDIHIPLGILKYFLIDVNQPNYFNYGWMGTVLGHELAHSLDPSGHLRDKDGKSVPLKWSNETVKYYQENLECIMDQNHKLPNVNITYLTDRTINEDFSDIVGFRQAYIAYFQSQKGKKPEQKLPGLEYNNKKMFWLAAANFLCYDLSPKEIMNKHATDEHSPHEIRVLSAMSNIPEFAEDFECPSGSKMNPKKKCKFW